MYIGLLSDTHGIFSPQFREFFAPVDALWHAGDFGGDLSFVREIAAFKPLKGVYGNCDGQDIRTDCPLFQSFSCEGVKVLMTHIGGYPGHYDFRALARIDELKPDLFVCGHSHILKVMRDHSRNMLCMNPGAAGLQGWHLVRTALRFHIDAGRIHDLEVFELPRSRTRL